MTKGLLGRKIGMTQLVLDNGELIQVTVVQAEQNVVLQKKIMRNDGYKSIQMGFDDERESRIDKAGKGHAENANTSAKRYVREIRNAKVDEYDVGQEINVETFDVGDTVDVTGTSKGKGFAGSVKRHNYATGFMTHGSRDRKSVV